MNDAVKAEQAKGRFVTCADCEIRMKDHEKRINSHEKDLAVLAIQMKINNWLSFAIAGGIVALVIKVYAGG